MFSKVFAPWSGIREVTLIQNAWRGAGVLRISYQCEGKPRVLRVHTTQSGCPSLAAALQRKGIPIENLTQTDE